MSVSGAVDSGSPIIAASHTPITLWVQAADASGYMRSVHISLEYAPKQGWPTPPLSSATYTVLSVAKPTLNYTKNAVLPEANPLAAELAELEGGPNNKVAKLGIQLVTESPGKTSPGYAFEEQAQLVTE